MLNDAGNSNQGYDSLGRLTQLRHLKDNAVLAGYAYGYNRENHRLYQEDLLNPAPGELYRYDSTYRLASFFRGLLAESKNEIVGDPSQSQTWQLDGVGNWAALSENGETSEQTINEMNEYDSFADIPNVHDANGNLTDDGSLLFFYDFANRLVEVRQKGDEPRSIMKYSFDAFNRRISKEYTRTTSDDHDGEYQSDSHTIALYHLNEETGPVVDSSGNDNHGRPPKHITRGVEGLWNTKAVEFSGPHIKVPNSKSLNSIEDQLTVETWVYLASDRCKGNKTLIQRPGSYELEIVGKSRKARFILFTQPPHHKHGRCHHKRHRARIWSDSPIPENQWVHLAAVYDGEKVSLYVNGVKQSDEKLITGKVKKVCTPLFLGGANFKGRLEEVRISDIARSEFGGGGDAVQVLRNFYYYGWRVLEEREQTASGGQFGVEQVSRAYVDGPLGIDEHLCVDIYNETGTEIAETYYFHENARGDVVLLTDENGEVVERLVYSPYGVAYSFNEEGQLEEFEDFSLVVYGFHGRRVDSETGLMYFRFRMYLPKQGRFMTRDPLEYMDGLNLYEALGGNPYSFSDALGRYLLIIDAGRQIKEKQEEPLDYRDVEGKMYKFPSFRSYEIEDPDVRTQLEDDLRGNITQALKDAIEQAAQREEPLDIRFEGHLSEVARDIFRDILKEFHQEHKINVRTRSLALIWCYSWMSEIESCPEEYKWKDWYLNELKVEYLILTGTRAIVDPLYPPIVRFNPSYPPHYPSIETFYPDLSSTEAKALIFSSGDPPKEIKENIFKYIQFLRELNKQEYE